jgi:hypothetical protein
MRTSQHDPDGSVTDSLKILKRALSNWDISRNKKNRSLKVKRIKSRIFKLFISNYNNNKIL